MGKRLILRRLYLKIHTKHARELTRFCEMFYRQSHINWKSGKSSRASNQYVPRHLDELNSTVQKNMFVFVCSFFPERCHGLWAVFFGTLAMGE